MGGIGGGACFLSSDAMLPSRAALQRARRKGCTRRRKKPQENGDLPMKSCLSLWIIGLISRAFPGDTHEGRQEGA